MVELKRVDMTKLAQDLVKDAGIVSGIGSLAKGLWGGKRLFAGTALASTPAVGALAAYSAGPSGFKAVLGNPDYQNRFSAASQEYNTRMQAFRDQNKAFLDGTGDDPSKGMFSRFSESIFGKSVLPPEARQAQYDKNMEALRGGTAGANIFGYNSIGAAHARAAAAAEAIRQGQASSGGIVQSVFGQNAAPDFDAVKNWQTQYGDMSRLGKISPVVKPNNPGYSWSNAAQNEYNIGRNYTPVAHAPYTQG